MAFTYQFPVVRGYQAHKEYFIAMVPLKMIVRLFPTDDEYVQPEYRAQRKLNIARIPIISQYILENRDSYVFSALAASIDGKFKFLESTFNPDLGILEVDLDARFLINDGQHRKAAILEALKEDSSLGDETISIVFFEDSGLERSQQIFTDLNKHAVKTSNSIAELYDSRDELAVLTRHTLEHIPFFNKYTDKEKDNLGKYSSKFFTLNTIYMANKCILQGSNIEEHTEKFIVKYWQVVCQHICQWNELEKKEINKKDLRENYIVTQAVVIRALGRVGRLFYEKPEFDLDLLEELEKIDWRRSAKVWHKRAINTNGRMISSSTAEQLIANQIKITIGLPLTPKEEEKEKNYMREIEKE